MEHLSNDVMERLKVDDALVFAIAKGMKKRFNTVFRWIMSRDEMLTSKGVVLIIKEETGLSEDQIVEGKSSAVQLTN